MSEIELYFDGASKNNGGESGCGFYITKGSENHKGYLYLGTQTNNFAEYSGLIIGLEHLVKMSMDSNCKIRIYGDSNLVIKQMTLQWKVKSENIKELFIKGQNLKNKFKNIEFIYIPREKNKIADTLANNAVIVKNSSVIVKK